MESIGSGPMELLLSFLLGMIASYFVWWLTAHYWVPNIKFSEELAEYVLSGEESFFQCAFENSGKRAILDLDVQVRIGVKGYLGAQGWAYHSVASNASRIPLLSKGKQRRVRIFDTRDGVEFNDVPSKSLRDAIGKCRSLREVFDLGSDGTVRVHVLGYDEFS